MFKQCVNSLEYKYTQKDLLENPEKYQRSKFEGIEFIFIFKKSRQNILDQISKNISISKLSDVYTICSESRTSSNTRDSSYDTTELLISYLTIKNYLNDKKHILEKILKNFEINKKIFSNYQFNPFNHSENYLIIENYVLFSLVCAKIYEETKNLKFLNTIIKLNDILCSRINSINESTTLSLIYYAVYFELKFVDDLLKTKVKNL